MKRLFLSIIGAALLAGCAAESAVQTYELSIDTSVRGLQNDLTLRSMNVIERRITRLGGTIIDQKIDQTGDNTAITIETESIDTITALTEELTEPFNVEILIETENEEEADVLVEGHGGFVRTGIENDDLTWAEAADSGDGNAAIRIELSEAGAQKLQELFADNVGNDIGIFVRGRLISKLNIQSPEVSNFIQIRNVPSLDMANIFVDDLNVGLHVEFLPLP